MSIDVNFIYGTPASIPSASETVAGKIRLATSAEATAGTNDLTAMTPAKVKAVIDASIAGGVTYRGTFDAGSPSDLSNAIQGDLYIISGAGTYAGRSWAVGDHLLVNADMGGTLSNSKIDKIDSTDAVTSVAGRTGAVTLTSADIGGLATVATSGAYADLSGTPSLATVATSGDYNDLSSLPTLGTAAALDVGTTALKVVQLDASARLPAVDGSQLINLPSAPVTSVAGRTGAITLSASDISGLATVATSGAYADLSGTPSLATVATSGAYADLSGTPSLATVATSGDYDDLSNLPTLGTAAALDVGTTALKVVQLDASAKLPAVDGSQLTNLPSAPVTSVAGRTGAITLSASDISGLATVATSGAYADLSGTPSLATVATSGDYNDLSNLPTLGTAAALDVGTTALKVVQLDASAKLPAVDGSLLTGLVTAHVPVNYTAADTKIDSHLAGVDTELGLKAVIADGLSQFEVDIVTVPPTDGQILLWSTASSKFLPGDPPAPVASTTQRGLVELATDAEATAGTSTDVVLTPSNLAAVPTGLLDNGAGTLLEAANNLSDLGDTATARTNLGLGTAATANTGTSAGDVVVLADVGGTVKLPALDGSQLTNVLAAPPTYSSKTANFTAAADYHYSVSAASGNITCTLPARSGVATGKQIRFKLYNATNNLILSPAGSDTIDGLASYTMGNPKQSLTLVNGANDWEII